MPTVGEASLTNVNCEPFNFIECQIAYWIWRTFMIGIIVIGICGNISCLIILSRKKMRKVSTNVFLLLLAASDLTVLSTGTLPETLYAITGVLLSSLSNVLCKTHTWVVFTSGYYSIWILVLFTIERAMKTRMPLFARLHLTSKTVLMESLVTLIVIMLTTSHIIYGNELFTVSSFNETFRIDNETLQMITEFPCFYTSPDYQDFYEGPWNYMVLVLFSGIPVIIIVIGNCNIGLAVMTHKKNRARLGSVYSHTQSIKTLSSHDGTAKTAWQPNKLGRRPKIVKQKSIGANITKVWNDKFQPIFSSLKEKGTQEINQTEKRNTERTDTEINNEQSRENTERVDFCKDTSVDNSKDTSVYNSKQSKYAASISSIKRKKYANRMSPTKLLFSLCVFFMITTLPYCVFYVLKGTMDEVSHRTIARLQLGQAIVHFLVHSNFTFNFFFYFVIGTQFKNEYQAILASIKTKLQSLNCCLKQG